MNEIYLFFDVAFCHPTTVPCSLEIVPSNSSDYLFAIRLIVSTQTYLVEKINMPQVRDQFDNATNELNKRMPKVIRDDKHRGRIAAHLLRTLLESKVLNISSMNTAILAVVRTIVDEQDRVE